MVSGIHHSAAPPPPLLSTSVFAANILIYRTRERPISARYTNRLSTLFFFFFHPACARNRAVATNRLPDLQYLLGARLPGSDQIPSTPHIHQGPSSRALLLNVLSIWKVYSSDRWWRVIVCVLFLRRPAAVYGSLSGRAKCVYSRKTNSDSILFLVLFLELL